MAGFVKLTGLVRFPLRLLGATAQTFVPVGGPIITRHLQNFAALHREVPPLDFNFENQRVWILSPHPDDEVLGCGGLLARLAAQKIPTKVVFLTNGDGTRTTQFAHYARFPGPHDLFSIAQQRQGEAKNAALALGLAADDLEFIGFPDGGTYTMWQGEFSPQKPFTSSSTGQKSVAYTEARRCNAPYCRAELVDVLRESLEEFAPSLVMTTPEVDTHLDHKIAFRSLAAALQEADLKVRPAFWTFLIHYGIWPVPNGLRQDLPLSPPADLLPRFDWRALKLSPAEMAMKRAALHAHKTQLASTPRYLNAFVRQNELFILNP